MSAINTIDRKDGVFALFSHLGWRPCGFGFFVDEFANLNVDTSRRSSVDPVPNLYHFLCNDVYQRDGA